MRSLIDGRVEVACITLSRMLRCCKAMGALATPLLTRSGIYGVCYLRFRQDMYRYGLDWSRQWPQTEWLAAHRADPTVARQLAIAWNTDGKTRPPSQLEAWHNIHSLPRGLVRLEAPHDLCVFHPRVDSETDEMSGSESEDSIEIEVV